MMIVLIHNNETGTNSKANYDVEVRINTQTIARFPVNGHNRELGYTALLEKIAKTAWLHEVAKEDKELKVNVKQERKNFRRKRRK